jgi:glutamyl-tRNA synthetase
MIPQSSGRSFAVAARVTRFAPSPTGDLHLGGAFVALASHLIGERRLLRIEDIDTPRVVAGSAERIEEDLAWLGFRWDTAPGCVDAAVTLQSHRFGLYAAAIEELTRLGLTYLCDCSRSEIAGVASAPHAGEESVYPGTCREKSQTRAFKREPAVRLRVPAGIICGFVDGGAGGGRVSQHVDRDVGDFVLRRGDGVFSYQLAVAYDDAVMGITHVVRGRDLLASTPRQLLLMRLLRLPEPEGYIHLPLVLDDAGERVAKRSRGCSIRALRGAGVTAEAVLGELAHGLGLRGRSCAVSLPELERTLPRLCEIGWRRQSWSVPPHFSRFG